ncbi:F0F1 ATP synthase subunit B [Mycoplasma sp. 1654_15]|uniref:F0F1 ATP synthase subunit B n=1 Tax=Mycoplasma sp. 1654_15 TaxID=2725994 RepID=UPI0014490CF6|nr:F0F1 ATP synthase subunit B [Mycoplasma sp. 1654_15]QJB71381.1 F0F1 ATP synthase subunit B [Mycoplasma sp. 1654_15]
MILQNVTNFASKSELSQDIDKLFKGLFPNPWIMLATVLSFAILFLILSKFLYKPLKKNIEKRRKFLQDNIDATIENKEKSLQLVEEKNKELLEAKLARQEIIAKAKIQAANIATTYTNNAKAESKRIVEEGKFYVLQLKQKAEQETKKEIISTATVLASKILEKNITYQDEQELIDELFKDIELQEFEK